VFTTTTTNRIVFFINLTLELKKMTKYNEVFHKIQQLKMKELWDNKEDECWGIL
jgi:hypothetical protein